MPLPPLQKGGGGGHTMNKLLPHLIALYLTVSCCELMTYMPSLPILSGWCFMSFYFHFHYYVN